MSPARRITLRGTLYDDVIRTRRPGVEESCDSSPARIAPWTDRKDAIGLLGPPLSSAPALGRHRGLRTARRHAQSPHTERHRPNRRTSREYNLPHVEA